MSETTGPIVGIDLGTTNSVIAVVINGKPEVLCENGDAILPSVVGVDSQGKLITGTTARNQQIAFPERTIVSVKRYMGTMEKLPLGEQNYTPPEISAMILRRLRDRASRALGTDVTRAVITVPAFFDENQRQATREAGELAGFSVERIINEPTAATLVYHAGTHERRHIVVYDFGGGTFDVSVVRMEAGVVEVLSSKGDTRLGGDDLDMCLMKFVADHFYDLHDVDLRTNASSRWRLIQACERAKCRLSDDQEVRIVEEFIAEKDGKPLNLELSVSRDDYEKLIEPFVIRTISCVDDALRDARMKIDQIDDLVLVGGSTRTPLVQSRLRTEFAMEPSRAVDPDLAVALGAAMQAAMLDGQTVGPILVDVTGHTLGIEALVGFGLNGPELAFSPIIHRNSPLPAVHEQSYHKVSDQQDSAEIRVLQGESSDLDRNTEIGEFKVKLDSGGGERSRIVVRFDLTLDGILKVTATQPATGKKETLSISNALSQFRAEDRADAKRRLQGMFDESSELLGEDEHPSPEHWVIDPPSSLQAPLAMNAATQRAIDLLQRAKKTVDEIEGEDSNEMDAVIQRLASAIEENDESSIQKLSDELDDILFYVQ